jgi:hypothetical protein
MKSLWFGCWVLLLVGLAPAMAGERIRLSAEMLVNLSGQRPAVELVDEQDLAGDPRMGTAPQPKTVYSNGWINAKLYYPLAVVVDLGVVYDLTDICWFDVEDQGVLSVDYRDADAWKPLFSGLLSEYRKWTALKVAVATRYVRLTFESPSARIAEVVFYGTARGQRPAVDAPVAHPRALLDSFIGVNGFVDDPIERLAACGHLREYHQWQWDEGNQDTSYPGYPNHQLAWSPSWVSGPGWGWDFDRFYQQLKDAGVEVGPCLQGCAAYVLGFDKSRSDEKPLSAGGDPERPQSYIAHASYLFQFAGRYGGTACDASLLKLKPGQPVRSGLGLVRYIENCNEPDKWWKGRAAMFSPFELAAMCSADYDGHRRSMGPTVGVKNADPGMKLVLGGLAKPEIEYLKAMKLWADFNRGGEFPADIINLHHYCNDAASHDGRPTVGISPEADNLRERFQTVVQWRDRFLPDKELWVSEFGYDTNPKSTQHAPAIGAADAQEVQGQWIVRSFLALAAAGVDRAQLYMLRDVDANSPTQYDTSGLTSEKAKHHQPKRAWYYVAALRHILRGTRFESEIPSGDAHVRVYRFRSDDAPVRRVYAIWCPTSSQGEVREFSLEVSNAPGGTLIALSPQSPTGQTKPLTGTNGRVTLDVSERPVFVTVP